MMNLNDSSNVILSSYSLSIYWLIWITYLSEYELSEGDWVRYRYIYTYTFDEVMQRGD